MGELVNLKARRKRAAREEKARAAAENRARFGRTRAERDLDAARAERDARILDQSRIERD